MKMNTTKLHYRQGDVMILRIEEVPSDIKRRRNHKRAILAHGELTGHKHVVHADSLHAYGTTEEIDFLVLEADGTITHQEHDPIAVPAGTYEIIRQREYQPEGIRNVAD